MLTLLETKLNWGSKSGLYIIRDACIYIYTPIYIRRLHHFQSNSDFPKVSKVSNLNKPVKNYTIMLLIQTKFRTLNPKQTVVIIFFTYIVTRLDWFI